MRALHWKFLYILIINCYLDWWAEQNDTLDPQYYVIQDDRDDFRSIEQRRRYWFRLYGEHWALFYSFAISTRFLGNAFLALLSDVPICIGQSGLSSCIELWLRTTILLFIADAIMLRIISLDIESKHSVLLTDGAIDNLHVWGSRKFPFHLVEGWRSSQMRCLGFNKR